MEPIRMIGWEGIGFLALMFGLAVYRGAGHREWWRGVLRVEEMQLLVVSLVVSARLVLSLVMGPRGTMAGVGTGWLVLLGASGGVYGARKSLKMRLER